MNAVWREWPVHVARRGALLLEVVIALAVLVTAMGLLGAQLARGLDMTRYGEAQLRAALLADRVLGLVQLDPNMRQRMAEYEVVEEPFGDAYPGFFYRVKAEPVERDNQELKVVTIEILHQPDASRPDSLDGAVTVRTLGLLKAEPAKINLIEQAGLSEELAEQLRQAIPIPGFDPRAVDLQQLLSLLDAATLEQLLPMLTPLLSQLASGGIPPQWASLAQEWLSGGPASELAPGMAGGMSAEELAETIRQVVGGAGQAPPPGGGRRPAGPAPLPTANLPGRPGVQPPTAAPPAFPPAQPPPAPPGVGPAMGRGSGPNGEYTIEDLMRMRDEWERQRGGGDQ